MQTNLPFAGRTALVTGAGRGIGREIAFRLGAAGAAVCVSARSEDELADVAKAVGAVGGSALVVPCDLSEADAATRLVETTALELGGLSILVNNAGGAHRRRALERLDPADFELGTTLNYAAVFYAMRAAARHLFAAAPDAAVLNITSIGAARGLREMSYYSGAKAAVTTLSQSAAREWGSRGVRVNCLAPGWIATELSRPLQEDEGFNRETLAQVPLGRWGTPEEVADAAMFLLSDAARYVTGTTLYVDGGLLA